MNTVRELTVAFSCACFLKEDGQVAKNCVLDLADVLRFDPVFAGRSDDRVTCVPGLLRSRVVPEGGVDGGETDDNVRVVAPYPCLGVHSGNVEGLAGIAGVVFVVLLEDWSEVTEEGRGCVL